MGNLDGIMHIIATSHEKGKAEGPIETIMDENLHKLLRDKVWITFHDLPNFASGPPPRGRFDTNSGKVC